MDSLFVSGVDVLGKAVAASQDNPAMIGGWARLCAGVRSDPRYRDLLRRLGYERGTEATR